MPTFLSLALFLSLGALVASARPTDLEAPYAALKTLSCDVERVSKVEGNEIRILSRVFYREPNHLLVENFSPGRRKILCDGKTLFFYDSSFSKGFKKSVTELDDWWLGQLSNLPATPFEHTRRLRNMEPRVLEENAEGRLLGYAGSHVWVEVRLDSGGLIRAIHFYSNAEHGTHLAHVEYTAYKTVGEIPLITEATTWKVVDNVRVEEKITFRNLQVNEPMADRLFDAAIHFQDVSFVDDYSRTLE